MRLVRPAGIAAALAFALAAPGAAASDSTTRLVEKVVRLLEHAAVVVQMNVSDCNAMGDKLEKLADDNADLLREMKDRNEKMSDHERAQLQARYGARVQAALVKISPGLRKCGSNPKVRDAVRKVK
jgi:hypothetical protein